MSRDNSAERFGEGRHRVRSMARSLGPALLGASLFALSAAVAAPCVSGMHADSAAEATAASGRTSRPCLDWSQCADPPARGAIETVRVPRAGAAASWVPLPRVHPTALIFSWSPTALAFTLDDDLDLDLETPEPASDSLSERWSAELGSDRVPAAASMTLGKSPGTRLAGIGLPSVPSAVSRRSSFRSQGGADPAASPPVASDPVTPDRDSVDSRPQPVGAENAPTADEITPRLEEAVRKGFEYLRRQQKTDGAFGQGRFGQHVGVTSLCAIAFMADGNVPGRGDFAEQVEKALDFVLANSTETGLLVSDQTHGPMYGHGFATLFLGEIYGMNRDDDRVRDALVRAVQLIVASQNNEGGWRYNPVPDDADVSVTICQVMALRSARNAGIKVPKSTIDDATRYVRACQNADGGFRYMKDLGGSAWPRTAAGVASLFYAGVYEDQSIERGLDYLRQHAFPRGQAGGIGGGFSQPHYFYGHYYAVQAMYLAGGDRWKDWWPAIREELLAKQGADGSWTDPQGDAYGTAMALIVLQMPKRYLPIFQR